jgi:uncharacterized protein (DUF2141 family)
MRPLPLALGACLVGTAQAHAATLVVNAEGIKGRTGEVRVAVCESSFDEAGCPRGATRAPTADTERFVFEDLSPGRYAVAVYHDLNGNGAMDTFPPGLPTEPYGFSNDVGRLSPPNFDKALVEVAGDTTVVVRVRRLLGGD